ncbi:hypothetical protein D9M69_724610 [compost metagenome]
MRTRRPADAPKAARGINARIALHLDLITRQRMHFVAMGEQQQFRNRRIADQWIDWMADRQAQAAVGDARQPLLARLALGW